MQTVAGADHVEPAPGALQFDVKAGLGHAIAMARVAIENGDTGLELEVGKLDGQMKRLPCVVTSLPFVDPERNKPRA